MGFAADFTYASAEDVFAEIVRFANPSTGYDLGGVTYDRLREGPVQWPAAPGGPARNPIRYLDASGGMRFATPSGRAVFHARPHVDPAELPDDDHPFTFNTGRLPHQWHTMTKTGKVARLNRLDDGPFVEVHPADAAPLGITSGDVVEVASRRGRAVLPAVVSDRVQPGNLFAPIHWNDRHGEYASVNAVTNDAVDPVSFQPELKVCAVALTKVAVPAAALPVGTGAAAGSPALVGVRPPALTERRAPVRRRLRHRARGARPAARGARPPARARRCRPPCGCGSTACWPGPFAGRAAPQRAGSRARAPSPSCGRRRPATPRSSRRPSSATSPSRAWPHGCWR